MSIKDEVTCLLISSCQMKRAGADCHCRADVELFRPRCFLEGGGRAELAKLYNCYAIENSTGLQASQARPSVPTNRIRERTHLGS